MLLDLLSHGYNLQVKNKNLEFHLFMSLGLITDIPHFTPLTQGVANLVSVLQHNKCVSVTPYSSIYCTVFKVVISDLY